MAVVLSLTISLGVGLILVLIPGLEDIGFTSLITSNAPEIIGYIFAIIAGYCVFAQLGKIGYVKLFHDWL